jgi:hypothetical protein
MQLDTPKWENDSGLLRISTHVGGSERTVQALPRSTEQNQECLS